jgi:hypothetical protein
VAKMLYGSGPVTKKISKKTLIKHRPGDRFDDLMRGEFFNGAFKKSLLVSHEWPPRKQLFRLLTDCKGDKEKGHL